MSSSVVICQQCGSPFSFGDRLGFRENCACSSDLHCCLNCHFYDERAYHQCREPQADFVKEKDRANYCEYFRPATEAEMKEKGALKKKGQASQTALSAAEKLFKKNKPSP